MGPRSIERGNIIEYLAAIGRKGGLQWGRAQSSAEIHQHKKQPKQLGRLQWGRAQSSAEMLSDAFRSSAAFDASMGPRSIERGNWYENAWGKTVSTASMGPRSIGGNPN